MHGYAQIEEALRIERALRKAWVGEEIVYFATKSELQTVFNTACDIQEKLKAKLGEPKKGGSLIIQTHIYDPCEAYFNHRYQEAWNTWHEKASQYAWSSKSKEPSSETK